MLYYAASLDRFGKSLADYPHLGVYEKHYGFSGKDLGLYALRGHELAGAAWIRLLGENDAPEAFVDDATPVLMMAVKPQFRGQGIGSMMLEQLLCEAGAIYNAISVSAVCDSPAFALCERQGFVKLEGSETKSFLDGTGICTMFKQLSKTPLKRPSDGYDPRRWMD